MTAAHPPSWTAEAIRRVLADGRGGAPTPLHSLPLPAHPGIDVYLKDESAHPTASLKYRLMSAMYCHAVASGRIRKGRPVIAAGAGAAAVAAAHFAAVLDLPFTAVVPPEASAAARERIEQYGGHCQDAEQPPAAVQEEARAVAERAGGHFLDHYADAGTAVESCGGPTIADEIFEQLAGEAHPVPEWIAVGAGTGATSAAIGRHVRRTEQPTRLAVVDPENSAYFPAWTHETADYSTGMPSRIPGVGRPRVEPGFDLDVVDLVIPVPDAASVAAAQWLHERTGIDAGPSTGTNLWGVCHLAARMRAAGTSGSIVTVVGDSGAAHREAHGDRTWLADHGLDPGPFREDLARFAESGYWAGR